VDLDLPVSDGQSVGDRLDDAALLVRIEVVPVAVEVLGLPDQVVARRSADFQVVEFALEPRQLVTELVAPDFDGLVALADALLRQLAAEVARGVPRRDPAACAVRDHRHREDAGARQG